MTRTPVDQQTLEARADSTPEAAPSAVVRILLAIIDAELADGPERRNVLNAALELSLLDPDPADLASARAEVVAEHDSLVRVLTSFPGQRGARDDGTAVASAELHRDRRLEVLELAVGLGQRAQAAPPA